MRGKLQRLGGPERADHPFLGDAFEVLFPMPPMFGVPFTFLYEERKQIGSTSQIMQGTFEIKGGEGVFLLRTRSGSEYRLTVMPEAEDGILGGGPVGHA